jgi:hypothetical protein
MIAIQRLFNGQIQAFLVSKVLYYHHSLCVKAQFRNFLEVYQGDDKVDIIPCKLRGFFAQLFGRNDHAVQHFLELCRRLTIGFSGDVAFQVRRQEVYWQVRHLRGAAPL